MKQVNVHEAKTHLSRLLEEAAAGEEIVIAKAGRPVARLVAVQADAGERRLGLWRGRITMQADFEELPEEIAAAFRGERE